MIYEQRAMVDRALGQQAVAARTGCLRQSMTRIAGTYGLGLVETRLDDVGPVAITRFEIDVSTVGDLSAFSAFCALEIGS